MPLPTLATEKEFHRYTAALLRSWIVGFDAGTIRLRIPRMLGLMKAAPGLSFHLEPELFFQISGITRFEFPEEKFDLLPGEICLVPVGMPHGEQVRAYKKEPFLNLMFGYQNQYLSFHLAREVRKGKPDGFAHSHLHGLHLSHLLENLHVLAERFHEDDPDRALAVKSTLLNHLFTLLHLLERDDYSSESRKVIQIKGMLRRHLGNPELSVQWIARNLSIGPDHVSRLFKKATGQTLAASIIEQRLLYAQHLLEDSSLNISEISRAVGYENPNYFTQLFRKTHRMPPRQYRLKHAREQ